MEKKDIVKVEGLMFRETEQLVLQPLHSRLLRAHYRKLEDWAKCLRDTSGSSSSRESKRVCLEAASKTYDVEKQRVEDMLTSLEVS